MKKYFTLILLINLTLLISLSCKKKDTKSNNDVSSTKSTSPTKTDSTSVFYLLVNGTLMNVSDTIIRDSTANTYLWRWRNTNSSGSIIIQFSGTTPALTTYSIVNDSLQSSPSQCYLMLAVDYGRGNAVAGTVTISSGSPDKISFTNILLPGTLSNTAVTYTVSGNIPFYF